MCHDVTHQRHASKPLHPDAKHRLFGGNGTSQALIILLAYLVVLGTILAILDWYRRPAPEIPEVPPERDAAIAAVAIPAAAPL